jgi:hypothetical protein
MSVTAMTRAIAKKIIAISKITCQLSSLIGSPFRSVSCVDSTGRKWRPLCAGVRPCALLTPPGASGTPLFMCQAFAAAGGAVRAELD